MIQRSLVLLKPDAVKRGIVGEIIDRFEQTGLKIVGAKFMQADPKLIEKHYRKDDVWAQKIGTHRLEDAAAHDIDVMEVYGTSDAIEIGHLVNKSNIEYLVSGPLFAMVLEGFNAVAKIRNMVGPTFCLEAPPGTIRGDYGLEDSLASLVLKRTIYTLIHASGTEDEAKEEIDLWFKPEELISYRRVHEDLYSY